MTEAVWYIVYSPQSGREEHVLYACRDAGRFARVRRVMLQLMTLSDRDRFPYAYWFLDALRMAPPRELHLPLMQLLGPDVVEVVAGMRCEPELDCFTGLVPHLAVQTTHIVKMFY
jgi:hypothetical protein